MTDILLRRLCGQERRDSVRQLYTEKHRIRPQPTEAAEAGRIVPRAFRGSMVLLIS